MNNFRKAAILLDDKHLGMIIWYRDAEHTPSSQMEPAAKKNSTEFFFFVKVCLSRRPAITNNVGLLKKVKLNIFFNELCGVNAFFPRRAQTGYPVIFSISMIHYTLGRSLPATNRL